MANPAPAPARPRGCPASAAATRRCTPDATHGDGCVLATAASAYRILLSADGPLATGHPDAAALKHAGADHVIETLKSERPV